MMKRFETPRAGLSRQEFLAATGVTIASALAGCKAGRATKPEAASTTITGTQSVPANLPVTSSLTVVDVDDQGGKVTMRTQRARHETRSSSQLTLTLAYISCTATKSTTS
jgi:hypothetical protein